MRSRPSLVLTAAAPSLVIAMFAPAAHAVCANPVADGRKSVVDCRPLGHEQVFVVPAGVRSLHVAAAGAPGGGGMAVFPGGGGAGGVASADLAVKPGTRLYLLVGGIGRSAAGGGAGGFNGGGRGGSGPSAGGSILQPDGGGGGGASDVRSCSIANRACDTRRSRLLVAAGGGGGGAGSDDLFTSLAGGRGGSALGNGTGGAGTGAGPGAGATAAKGGAGGAGAGAGRLGTGGSGAAGAEAGGGGGGGRYGGGGGGAAGGNVFSSSGGGAGSSFGPKGVVFAPSTLAQGFVRITYVTRGTANRAPAVRISTPRSGASVPRRGLVFRGRARDSSGVRAVALRIERLPRPAGRCTWLDPVSGLGRASCSAPPSLSATLRSGGAWSYRVPAGIALPAGRYRVTAYATDETGIYGNSARAAARSVRFAVRR
jgi:hypothetical protein